ncbi:hypothetical protein CBR_g18872 [Chara braunii]|uniref:Uncharacterized protein n=1 Tax=Chara braunii TaxID=69332 RepID=A0A388KWV4_CHABU|nr:hypothetical protein CBR_g18872 [Chara braunii]|eukprot:GBG74462.1 hypothetical protein CBR_g18872 [Chara braunii]
MEDSSQGTKKDVNMQGSHHSSQPTGPSENQTPDASRDRKRNRLEGSENQRTEEEEADGDAEDSAIQDSEDEGSKEEDEDMGDEEDEQGQSMDSLDYVQQYIRSLELDRIVELEVRLAHHKHLRNLKSATKVEDNISMEKRFEILKKEKELNEFYAVQYSMKTRTEKNIITVDTKSYEQRFT